MTYLVNIMRVNNVIETSVQIVQEMHHLRKDSNRSIVLVTNISIRCSGGVLRTGIVKCWRILKCLG